MDIPATGNGPKPNQRVWARPSEIPTGSSVARQLDVMRKLVRGEVGGPQFAREWLAGRQAALAKGERVREPFERALLDVFYALDESYAIDPLTREASDMTEEQLVKLVGDALERLDRLNT
ncbi:hypothetical protein [Actinokineospora diospyrosa]|uniref:Self-protective colicin-like immunity protein n=1 Tax=Actinokineospora diospyrosa TaxID=103728 RepID=A0ABT1I518_9PSEU|nr:hypothetical protein [Actinokineospora diospyrosa]MCP2267667.1 hypothetical protein [Actinokineospora diospyrosa]